MLLWADQPAAYPPGTPTIATGWTDGVGCYVYQDASKPRTGAGYITTNSNLVNWCRKYPGPGDGTIAPVGATAIVMVRYRVSSLGARGGICTIYDGATGQICATSEPGGVVCVRRGVPASGTLLATSVAGILSVDTWYWIGFLVVLHGSTGEAHLFVDNTERATATGANTAGAGTAAWNGVLHGLGDNAGGVSLFSDVIYCDGRDGTSYGQAAAFNTVLNDRKVELLPAQAGNGTYADFTPSSGTDRGAMVDDGLAGPDGDSTYNSSSTAGARDSYALANLPSTAVTVDAVLPLICSTKNDGGARQFKPLLVVGGSPYAGTAVEVPAVGAYSFRREVITKNPATGAAWLPAAVNALELGQELV